MYLWGLSRLKRGPRNGKNVEQRERVNKSKEKREKKKMTFPLVFILSTLEIVSGEKKTFTANFAQSAENNAHPVFIKSDV